MYAKRSNAVVVLVCESRRRLARTEASVDRLVSRKVQEDTAIVTNANGVPRSGPRHCANILTWHAIIHCSVTCRHSAVIVQLWWRQEVITSVDSVVMSLAEYCKEVEISCGCVEWCCDLRYKWFAFTFSVNHLFARLKRLFGGGVRDLWSNHSDICDQSLCCCDGCKSTKIKIYSTLQTVRTRSKL